MSDTNVDPVVEPVVEPPVVAVEPAPIVESTEPEPPQPVVTDHGNKGKKPWFLERISQESQRAQTAEERAATAERRAQEAEALLQRTQGGNPPPQPQVTQPQVAPQDIDRLVDQRANEKQFFKETSEVRNAGLQKFGAQFENDLNILTAIGATSNDMVADILAVDKSNAHVMLNKLAQDPEKAAVLAKMDTRTRIAELTRMTIMPAEPAKSATPPKQVSKAPAPPPPVEPSASKVVDWRSDDVSDAEFSRGWNENMRKRHANR